MRPPRSVALTALSHHSRTQFLKDTFLALSHFNGEGRGVSGPLSFKTHFLCRFNFPVFCGGCGIVLRWDTQFTSGHTTYLNWVFSSAMEHMWILVMKKGKMVLHLFALRLRIHLASLSLSSFLFSFLSSFRAETLTCWIYFAARKLSAHTISTSRNCLLNMNFKVIEVG